MIPSLRFPQFNNDWQVKKLGEIAQFSKGANISKADIAERGKFEAIRYGELYTTYSEVIKDVKSKTNLDQDKLVFSKSNDIIIPASGETHIDLATASTILRDGIALGGDINIIRTDENGVFLAYYLNNPKKRDIAKLAQGVSVVHLYSSNLKALQVSVPSVLEQQKIADFLTAVDYKITAIDKKVELLKKYKKGVMQKIFTQQIRFKSEDGQFYPEWQEKRLSSFLIERNEQAPKSDQYPLMAFVAYKGVIPKGERYNREFLVNGSGEKKYKRTEYGDFIYSSNNLETGSIGLNRYGSASISPVYSIFQTDESCVAQFMGIFLLRKRFINKMTRYRQGVVYGQWRIHESDFLNIKERIPSTKEQQKIANFLALIDDKIKTEEAKLTTAKKFKSALLQKMFI